MTGAERAKLSRIRAKVAKGIAPNPEEEAWIAARDLSRAVPLAAPATVPGIMPSTVPGSSAGPAVADAELWDRVIDTTSDEADDEDDAGDDAGGAAEVAPVAPGAEGPGGNVAKPAPPASMSLEVARGTAASAFLLQSSAWSILGDRDTKELEPTDEEMRLLSKVFASYAERFGWTHEIDDMILLGTVLLVYNARCMRAPRKKPKSVKPIGPA